MAGVPVGDGSYNANFIAAAGGFRVSFDRSNPMVILRGPDGKTEYGVAEHARVEALCATVEEGEVVVYLATMVGDGVPRRDVRLATGKRAIQGGTLAPPPPAPAPGGDASFPGAIQPDDTTALNGVSFGGQAVRTTKVQVWDQNSAGETWTRAWENGAVGDWQRVG